MIPGSNLLKMALSVISSQKITYYRFVSRALNNIGQDVATYSAPIFINGSFQPVPRRLYQQYGLDLQKTYFTFYSLNDLLDIERNVSGDQIAFNGQRYQCESDNDWYAIDKWKGILCVLINDFEETERPIFGFGADLSLVNTNFNFENGNFKNE